MEELLKLVKQCLSIVETSTLKDKEIEMLINAGIADLNRQAIVASVGTTDSLIQSAIVMFVKANFGNVDIKEKELAQKTYSLLCTNIGASQDFLEVEENA